MRAPHSSLADMLLRFCFLAVFLLEASASARRPEPTPCPQKCKCFWFKDPESVQRVWVDCAGVPISSPDSYDVVVSGPALAAETAALDMTYNNISKVYATDVTPSLTLLRIQSNAIQSLQSDSFTNFPNLEVLDLGYNNISRVDPQTFTPLTNLKVLKLNSNALAHLPEHVFQRNLVLRELHLSHNPLKILYPEWFASLQQLQLLDVSQTQLYAIRPETLHSLRSLRSLDLSSNLLRVVPTDALIAVPSLRRLRLNSNPIRFLEETSFERLTHVQELEVCHMEHLVEIGARTFKDMTSLQNLTISDCHDLSFLHESAFHGMFNRSHFALRRLTLRKNGLRSLLSHSLPFDLLERLEIQQNPWNCDCDFLWVTKCPSLVGDPRCAQPKQFRGLEVHHIARSAVDACQSRVRETSPAVTPTSDAGTLKTLTMLMAATLLLVLGVALALVIRRQEKHASGCHKGRGSIYYVKADSRSDVPLGSLI